MSGERTPPRPPAPQGGMFGRGPMSGIGLPVQKAKNFKGSLARLLEYLRPHRAALIVVLAAAALSTIFNVIGPKILGQVTTKIFEGFIARARGLPGSGIDFGAVGHILLELIALYLVSALFQYADKFRAMGQRRCHRDATPRLMPI